MTLSGRGKTETHTKTENWRGCAWTCFHCLLRLCAVMVAEGARPPSYLSSLERKPHNNVRALAASPSPTSSSSLRFVGGFDGGFSTMPELNDRLKIPLALVEGKRAGKIDIDDEEAKLVAPPGALTLLAQVVSKEGEERFAMRTLQHQQLVCVSGPALDDWLQRGVVEIVTELSASSSSSLSTTGGGVEAQLISTLPSEGGSGKSSQIAGGGDEEQMVRKLPASPFRPQRPEVSRPGGIRPFAVRGRTLVNSQGPSGAVVVLPRAQVGVSKSLLDPEQDEGGSSKEGLEASEEIARVKAENMRLKKELEQRREAEATLKEALKGVEKRADEKGVELSELKGQMRQLQTQVTAFEETLQSKVRKVEVKRGAARGTVANDLKNRTAAQRKSVVLHDAVDGLKAKNVTLRSEAAGLVKEVGALTEKCTMLTETCMSLERLCVEKEEVARGLAQSLMEVRDGSGNNASGGEVGVESDRLAALEELTESFQSLKVELEQALTREEGHRRIITTLRGELEEAQRKAMQLSAEATSRRRGQEEEEEEESSGYGGAGGKAALPALALEVARLGGVLKERDVEVLRLRHAVMRHESEAESLRTRVKHVEEALGKAKDKGHEREAVLVGRILDLRNELQQQQQRLGEGEQGQVIIAKDAMEVNAAKGLVMGASGHND